MAELTITEFTTKWDNNDFTKDVDSMIQAGWYDWFCEDKALYNRLKDMVPKIKFIAQSGFFNPDECYVWFKNNCPVNGSLYDDFRICKMDGTQVMGICPSNGHSSVSGKADFWHFDSNGNYKSIDGFTNWSSLKAEMISGFKDIKNITKEI